jgi:hypothetical protein
MQGVFVFILGKTAPAQSSCEFLLYFLGNVMITATDCQVPVLESHPDTRCKRRNAGRELGQAEIKKHSEFL